jgi:hypothetical protein
MDWLTQPFQAVAGLIGWIVSFLGCFLLNVLNALLSLLGYVGTILVAILPSTPDELKLGALLTGISSFVPFVARGEIVEIFTGISGIFVIYIVIKVIKLLPLM